MSQSPAIVAAAMTKTERITLVDALVRLTAGQPHDVSPGLLQDIAGVCKNIDIPLEQ
jgi:hypothetical protein